MDALVAVLVHEIPDQMNSHPAQIPFFHSGRTRRPHNLHAHCEQSKATRDGLVETAAARYDSSDRECLV